LDLSVVTFQGQSPVAVNYQNSSVSFLVGLSGGTSFTLDAGNPSGPGTYADGTKGTSICGSAIDTHIVAGWLSFEGFDNQLVTMKVTPGSFTNCIGAPITFSVDKVPPGMTCGWDVGDATVTPSGAQHETAVVVFNTPGPKTVKATAGSLLGLATGSVGPTNIITQTLATTPSDRQRKTVGVGEIVYLTLSPECSDTTTWSIMGGDGSLGYDGEQTITGNPVIFVAPDHASSSTIKATYAGYPYSVTI
jgi:hypothetical protein